MTRRQLRSSSSLQSEIFRDSSTMMGAIGAPLGARFPESSQRTTVSHNPQEKAEAEEEEEEEEEGLNDLYENVSETASPSTTSPRISHRTPPIPDPGSPSHRVSRRSMMRLENILNDVSINDVYELRPRSRSLGRSPAPEDAQEDEAPIAVFTSSSLPETVRIARSASPTSVDGELSPVKKKKVKMHRCPECHKDFPRPSGLRTHMNMHTKQKPFGCTFPGCRRTFSVVSNAKRHMRTHGVGINIDEAVDQANVPYVVGFDTPMVAEPQPADVVRRDQMPFRLRWMQESEVNPRLTSSFASGSAGGGEGSMARAWNIDKNIMSRDEGTPFDPGELEFGDRPGSGE